MIAMLQCLMEAADHAGCLAERLGVPLRLIDVHRFPDGN